MTILQSFGGIHNELVLLAPPGGLVPAAFTRRHVDQESHTRLLREVQRVRGSIYLSDGALDASQLTSDGRHVQPSDYDSWHLLAVNANGEVQGCARYRHLTGDVGFEDLVVRESWLARCAEWGPSLKGAVEAEIARAKQRGAAFSEVGGWAIVPEKRCTTEALRIAMATYSLAQILGGCVGISTATERHRSSAILRRIGGRSLQHKGTELPSYYDPQYRCQMEVLRFDSSSPSGSCRRLVEHLNKRFVDVAVMVARKPAESRFTVPPLVPALVTPLTWPGMPRLEWVT